MLNNWSAPLNWLGLTPPVSGDDVVFSGILQTTNINDIANLNLHSITFSANNFVLSGNAITLAAGGPGITADAGMTGTATINLSMTLASTQTITVTNAGAVLSVGGNLNGGGGLTKAGAGKVILSGSNNFAGTTTVNAGTLMAGAPNVVPNNLVISGGALFDESGFAQTVTGISGAGTITNSGSAAIFTVNNPALCTFDGALTGALSLSKTNSGTLNLTNAVNVYTGSTTFGSGILNVVSGALGSGNITFTGGTLRYAAGNTQDLSGRIVNSSSAIKVDANGNNVTFSSVLSNSNTGGLTKLGGGALILAANDLYSGLTSVNSGTLLVNGAIQGGVIAAAGTILGGNGIIGGDVNLASGATFNPGSPVTSTGMLRTGNLTFTAGADYSFQLNSTSAGNGYDQANVTGMIDVSGATLTGSLGFVPAIGAVFTIVGGANGVTGTFNNLAEGDKFFIGGRLFSISYTGGSGHDVTLTVIQVTLTVTGITASNKTYDGTTSVSLNTAAAALAGIVAGDPGTVTLDTTSAVAAFTSKNVGTGVAVTVSGMSISGTSALNYFLTSPVITANITTRTLNVAAISQNKIYDGTATATVNLTDDRVAGDVLTTSFTTASFADKNVGNGRIVTIAGIVISGGTDFANYTLASNTATTIADITPRTLHVAASGQDKMYDGNANAIVTLLSDALGSDSLNLSYASASFFDKNTGSGKSITVTGISIGGADVANYVLASNTALTSANITARTLNVIASGQDKVYDGTTNAVVGLSNDALIGDMLNLAYASATFGDKDVGIAKVVGINGISIAGGADAGNYVLSSTIGATAANITVRNITVTASTHSKVYDQTTTALVTPVITTGSLAPGDIAGFSETYATKNAGNNLALMPSGSVNDGNGGNNYSITFVADNTGVITPRMLTVTGSAQSKLYDGTTAVTVTLSDDALVGDVANLNYTTAMFNDKNAGGNKPITVQGISISGVDAINYSLASASIFTTATITARTLNVSASGQNKIYDGGTGAVVVLSSDALGGDSLSLNYGSANYNDKNVGTGKTIHVIGIGISGADVGNYILGSTTADTTSDVTPRTLTVTASGQNKVYDGTTNAAVTLSDDRISGDIVNLNFASAVFNNKNVGTGKSISVSGIVMNGGADAPNYILASPIAFTAANIVPRVIIVTTTGQDKFYDGTANATVILSSNAITGDSLSVSDTGSSFVDKNAGLGKAIIVMGIGISGTDAGNYFLMSSIAQASANVLPRNLTVMVTAANKTYDGTTDAFVILSSDAAPGDAITLTYAAADFSDKNAGVGKAVSVSGVAISGADAGNYALNSGSVIASANISPRILTVRAIAHNKNYDGTTHAVVDLTDDRISGDNLTESFASAQFADEFIGLGKRVTVSGILLVGADAANYVLASILVTAEADILQQPTPEPVPPPTPDPVPIPVVPVPPVPPTPTPIPPTPRPVPPPPKPPNSIPIPPQPKPPGSELPLRPAPAPTAPLHPPTAPTLPAQTGDRVGNIEPGPQAEMLLPPRMPAIVQLVPVEAQSIGPLKLNDIPRGVSRAGVAISIAITAGFVIELVIPRSLLASLLASMPIWRWFDPVPILSSKNRQLQNGQDQHPREPAVRGVFN